MVDRTRTGPGMEGGASCGEMQRETQTFFSPFPFVPLSPAPLCRDPGLLRFAGRFSQAVTTGERDVADLGQFPSPNLS